MVRRGPVVVAAVVAVALPASAQADDCTGACEKRVQKREARQKWRRAVADYGPGLLTARMRCESGSSGGYSLSTTGNGYWFSMQFDLDAWRGAGGRVRDGRPVGVWSRQPSRLEQRFRAVVWDRKHGGDPWPSCP